MIKTNKAAVITGGARGLGREIASAVGNCRKVLQMGTRTVKSLTPTVKSLTPAREERLLHALSGPAGIARFISFLRETETITGRIFCLDSRII